MSTFCDEAVLGACHGRESQSGKEHSCGRAIKCCALGDQVGECQLPVRFFVYHNEDHMENVSMVRCINRENNC